MISKTKEFIIIIIIIKYFEYVLFENALFFLLTLWIAKPETFF